MTLFQLALAQLSVRHADAGFGQQGFQSLAHVFDGIHFIVQENTCPPRLSSRNTASRTLPSLKGLTKVLTARRRLGAVVISEKSRRPSSAMLRVRGIGVGGHGEDVDIGAQAF